MAVEIGSVYRQDLPIVPRGESTPVTPADKIGQPDYSALLAEAQKKTYSIKPLLRLENRPLEPMEPEPLKSTAMEWAEYVLRRDIARAYEVEHSLRGTF
nr:hypothetical protein [Candidatus Levybacteria bacterium]